MTTAQADCWRTKQRMAASVSALAVSQTTPLMASVKLCAAWGREDQGGGNQQPQRLPPGRLAGARRQQAQAEPETDPGEQQTEHAERAVLAVGQVNVGDVEQLRHDDVVLVVTRQQPGEIKTAVGAEQLLQKRPLIAEVQIGGTRYEAEDVQREERGGAKRQRAPQPSPGGARGRGRHGQDPTFFCPTPRPLSRATSSL